MSWCRVRNVGVQTLQKTFDLSICSVSMEKASGDGDRGAGAQEVGTRPRSQACLLKLAREASDLPCFMSRVWFVREEESSGRESKKRENAAGADLVRRQIVDVS